MEKASVFGADFRGDDSFKHAWIRTDGDRNIGFGHMVRCQALAAFLPKFTFLVSEPSVPFVPDGIPFMVVASDFSVLEAEKQSLMFESGDLLIIDSYLATADYVRSLRQGGIKTIQINDLPQDALPANVVINHCPGLSLSDFPALPETEFWLGLEYRLLRPDFQQPASIDPLKKAPHLFMCFGGTDGGRLVQNALDWASQLGPAYRVSAVVSNTQSYIGSLFPGLTLHSNLSASEMRSLMAECSLAWVPASTLSLECLVSGLPMIIGITAENQRFLHRGLMEFPSVASIGQWVKLNPNDLLTLSNAMLNQPAIERHIPSSTKLSNRILKLLS